MAMKLTTDEAKYLIDMMKNKVKDEIIDFPSCKGKIVFDVIGEKKNDLFTVNIDRKGKNANGCTYQGRVKANNQILIRLDVNPSSVHVNPSNGKKIEGTHLHIYSEKYEMSEAIPFDVNNKDLFDMCFEFFKLFNIVDVPTIQSQIEFEE